MFNLSIFRQSPAGGRDEIRFESRKNPKPEKCSKTAQNPTSRLHALLARF
jgi:hypothetical protein